MFLKGKKLEPGERAVENIEENRDRTAEKIIFIFFLSEKKERGRE